MVRYRDKTIKENVYGVVYNTTRDQDQSHIIHWHGQVLPQASL